jgi:hypothetical protein
MKDRCMFLRSHPSSGELVTQVSVDLPPLGTRHLVLNEITDIAKGFISIKRSNRKSLTAAKTMPETASDF